MAAVASLLRVLPFVLALVGCAHGVGVTYGTKGWVTKRTPHFIVHGDDGRSLGHVVERLEETYAALAGTFFQQTQLPPVEAILLERETFDQVAGGSRAVGLFVRGVGASGSLLLVRDDSDDWRALSFVVAHELTHRFVAAQYPTAPLWMNEGLAMFMETVAVKDDSTTFGQMPGDSAAHFRYSGAVPFAQLIAASGQKFYGDAASSYYSTAWALIHYLVTGKRGANFGRFAPLLQRVNDAKGEPALIWLAFRELYAEQDVAALEEASASNASRFSFLNVNTVLEVPSRRPAPPAVISQPADAAQLDSMLSAVAYRRAVAPQAIEPPRNLDGIRIVRLEAALGLPPEPGGAVGYIPGHRTGIELAFARSRDRGLQAGLLLRHYLPLGRENFLSIAFGPALALKSRRLGDDIESTHVSDMDPDRIYHHVALNPELSWELLSERGVTLHAGLGAYHKITENISTVCPPSPDPFGNCPADTPARRAGRSAQLYVRIGVGYQF